MYIYMNLIYNFHLSLKQQQAQKLMIPTLSADASDSRVSSDNMKKQKSEKRDGGKSEKKKKKC